MRPVVIVGGGLVGSLLSITLARRGLKVAVYEKAPDLRSLQVSPERPSINITLCERGLHALKAAGSLDDVMPLATAVYGRVVHHSNGLDSYQPYGESGDAIYSIRRNELNALLLDHAEVNNVDLHFDSRCVAVEMTPRLTVERRDGSRSIIEASCVIAADGVSSSVRARLVAEKLVEETIAPSVTGYKTFEVPAAAGHGWLIDGALHVWPRQEAMAIAFPNRDGSHAVALHMPMEGTGSFDRVSQSGAANQALAAKFGDRFATLLRHGIYLAGQCPNAMATVRCRPWATASTLLVGDAAHGVLPHYGQGANAGFEDCQLLGALVERAGPVWPRVFAEFDAARHAEGSAIADLCERQSHTLHYDVDSDEYGRRLRLEKRLREICPERVSTLYSMIAFSRTPYTEVLERDRRQSRILDELMAQGGVEESLRDDASVGAIRTRLEQELPVLAEIE